MIIDVINVKNKLIGRVDSGVDYPIDIIGIAEKPYQVYHDADKQWIVLQTENLPNKGE